jgi:tol-pal system protein YbgF
MPRRLVVVLAALLLVGCGSTFRRREVTVEQPPPPAAAERPVVQPPPEPPRLAEQLTRVAGELSELQNAVAKLIASSRQQEDQVANLQRRLNELEAQNRGRTPPAVPGGFAPGAPPPGAAAVTSATTAIADDLYRAGVEKFRAKDFDAAVLMFYDLIVTYPDHPLRERAQFLVADIFYTQKDYRGGLAEFEALLAAMPRGIQAAEALLKIGLCHRALGDRAQARRTWERLVREFPESVAARQARVLLRS